MWTPLRNVRALDGFTRYARDLLFTPTKAKVTVDGQVLPGNEFTGIHVASMSINLGGVLKFFGQADQPGVMNAIVGTPSPWSIVSNIPRMNRGEAMKGRNIMDRQCREMTLTAIGNELLEPIIDGEYYKNLKSMTCRIGPRVRIPKVIARGKN